MSSESFGLFKSSHNLQEPRTRLRWIEWLIAIIFFITLLIASGIFIEASNAADIRFKNSKALVLDPNAVIPGTIRGNESTISPVQLQVPRISEEMDDNSCELKPR